MSSKIQKLPFEQTNSFTTFFLDYKNKKESLEKFFNRYPSVDSFQQQILEKEKNYSAHNRNVLAKSLQQQYEGFTVKEAVATNLQALTDAKTFTVTTGHQLNIFTGPLYFIYKIVTVINACKQLKQQYPAYHFVPVYWMASEDHDYDEIKYVKLYGKKYIWNTHQQGAVGRFDTKDFKSLLDEVPGNVELFRKAYLHHGTLAKAVRYYVNEIFGAEGLVIVDGDDRELKSLFEHVVKDDLFEHTSKKLVESTNTQLEALGYKPQIHSREINFFYLENQLRSRIEKKGDVFEVVDTDIRFTKQEIEQLLKSHPEKFSPNVILRPLYEEVILPNLAYCGGPAEVVYWLQLQQVFAHFNTTFPVLLPRSFGMVIDEPTQRKIEKAGLALEEIFLEKNELFNHIVLKHSRDKIMLNGLKEGLESQFASIKEKAAAVDKTLEPMVAAETRRLQKSLAKIESKLLRAEKRKHEDKLRQIEAIKEVLFPNGSLQERTDNFLNFYQQRPDFIKRLLDAFDPFDLRFNVLYL
jgi:bacillithiol synthase